MKKTSSRKKTSKRPRVAKTGRWKKRGSRTAKFSPKSSFKYGKWALYGVGVVGLIFAYSKIAHASESGGHRVMTDESAPPRPASTTAALPVAAGAPDLNGPVVQQGKAAMTETQITTSSKLAGMKYAKITRTKNENGHVYRVFIPPVNGNFTRRLLSVNGKLWAEIKPA